MAVPKFKASMDVEREVTNASAMYTYDGRKSRNLGDGARSENPCHVEPKGSFYDPETGRAGMPGPAPVPLKQQRDEAIFREALSREYDIASYLSQHPAEARAVTDAVAQKQAQGMRTERAVAEVVSAIRQVPGFEKPADEARWRAEQAVKELEQARASHGLVSSAGKVSRIANPGVK